MLSAKNSVVKNKPGQPAKRKGVGSNTSQFTQTGPIRSHFFNHSVRFYLPSASRWVEYSEGGDTQRDEADAKIRPQAVPFLGKQDSEQHHRDQLANSHQQKDNVPNDSFV